jgi:hypothetical protein
MEGTLAGPRAGLDAASVLSQIRSFTFETEHADRIGKALTAIREV